MALLQALLALLAVEMSSRCWELQSRQRSRPWAPIVTFAW
jgi:hypothetical protein